MWSTLIWAIVLLIIVLLFKEQIGGLLETFKIIGNKAKKLKYRNFSIDLGENNPTFLGPQQEYANAKHLQYLKAFQSNVVTSEERLIRNQLIESNMSEEQALNVLIHHLANANLVVKLLIIDQLIFKEQIQLLMYLNSQVRFLSEHELKLFYDRWKENLGSETDYTFEGFLNFLSQQRLIIPGIDGYRIGQIGKEYLGFLVRIGKDIAYSKP